MLSNEMQMTFSDIDLTRNGAYIQEKDYFPSIFHILIHYTCSILNMKLYNFAIELTALIKRANLAE